MCEFCSLGPNSNLVDRDSSDITFSGFFSADAIESAIRQSQANQDAHATSSEDIEDDDEDGT